MVGRGSGWSVTRLCQTYNNDNDHTQHVADLAATLFSKTVHVHGQTKNDLPLLLTAAQLHDLSASGDSGGHPRTVRALILEHGVKGFSREQVEIIGCVAALHEDSSPPEESLLEGLSPPAKRTALRLGALLRVADGLDRRNGQVTEIADIIDRGSVIEVRAFSTDHDAAPDVECANERAKLWNSILPKPIQVVLARRKRDRRRTPLVGPKDCLGDAGLAVMRLHLERLVAHEQGTREGEDVEQLHDMRVAARRLRAAYRVFGKVLGKERLAPFVEDLRWIAAALGAVRDLDVFLLKLGEWYANAPRAHKPAVRSLIRDREAEREQRRKELLAVLDSERYALFKLNFGAFVRGEHPEVPLGGGPKVAKAAPKALARRLEAVLEDEDILNSPTPEQLHNLRIACKRLRYTAEFLSGAYGDALEGLIKRTVAAQDLLGEVHDADVHAEYLKEYVANLRLPSRRAATFRSAVARLLEDLQERRQSFLEEFQAGWQEFTSEGYQRKLRRAMRPAQGS